MGLCSSKWPNRMFPTATMPNMMVVSNQRTSVSHIGSPQWIVVSAGVGPQLGRNMLLDVVAANGSTHHDREAPTRFMRRLSRVVENRKEVTT